jgi:hypothetical protein
MKATIYDGVEPEDGYAPSTPIVAQGDSWFSFGSIPPSITGNILFHLDFTFEASIVDFAQPGALLSEMCTAKYQQFVNAMVLRDATAWAAILVSGGGNDLIAWANQGPSNAQKSRLFLTASERPSGGGIGGYISPDGWTGFRDQILEGYLAFDHLRQCSGNPGAPLVAHTYDYPTPRPAGVIIVDPHGWLYPAMETYDIPDADRVALAKYLVDQLAVFISGTVMKQIGNMFLIDLRGTLIPADPGTPGQSNDWANEIHPTPDGYVKLAQSYSAQLKPIGLKAT